MDFRMIFNNIIRECPKSSFKAILLSILLLTILTHSITVSVKADYIISDWGDVVKLKVLNNYQHPGREVEFYFDGYVNLYLGDSMPLDLNATYERLRTMFPVFREEVVGMRVGNTREFRISYIEAGITNSSDELWGADLIYSVEFREMLFDVKYESIFELTPTHPVTLLLLSITIVALFAAYHEGLFSKSFHKIEGLFRSRCEKCGERTSLRCASLNCRKSICHSCFTEENKCPFCKGIVLTNLTRK